MAKSLKLEGFGLFYAKFLNRRYNFSMAVQNLKITAENLLGAVINLPKNEFEQFVSDAKRLKKREELLLAKIEKLNLSNEERQIYSRLSQKNHEEELNSEEYKQLTDLIDKLEGLNVERLKCLVEIANIRQKNLTEVMADLNIRPKNYE